MNLSYDSQENLTFHLFQVTQRSAVSLSVLDKQIVHLKSSVRLA